MTTTARSLAAIGHAQPRAGASYICTTSRTHRAVCFARFGDGWKADYDAGAAQVFSECGYRIYLGKIAARAVRRAGLCQPAH